MGLPVEDTSILKQYYMREQLIPGDITYEINDTSGEGYLTVNVPTRGKGWQLVDIKVYPERNGLGKRLIQQFCTGHEHGTQVYGHIGHEESINTAANLGCDLPPRISSSIKLDDTLLIRTIPIFAFLESSGISVQEIEILFDCSLTEEPQISMSYEGITQ